MADSVITVDGVSKKFSKSVRHMMLYGTLDLTAGSFGIPLARNRLRRGEFWALRDINFEIKRGEAVGLIGANGAGKSTMLKLLNGIYMPDLGKISIRGRIGALIEVGAGFHPMLSGRENIYINGSILGMKTAEITRQLDSIIDFAGIEEFIDSPVRHYSSGMYVRLGFAIIAHCRPEILLIDEVLAVGDARFRRKCLDHLKQLKENGVTFVIVSHNMQTIDGIATKGIFFDHGSLRYCGTPGEAISHYEMKMLGNDAPFPETLIEGSTKPGSLRLVKYFKDYGTHDIRFEDVRITNAQGEPSESFASFDAATLKVTVASPSETKTRMYCSFINEDMTVCMGAYMDISLKTGIQTIKIKFDPIQLTTGRYMVSLRLYDEYLTNPYANGHFGYFSVMKGGCVETPGTNTPYCWRTPEVTIA